MEARERFVESALRTGVAAKQMPINAIINLIMALIAFLSPLSSGGDGELRHLQHGPHHPIRFLGVLFCIIFETPVGTICHDTPNLS
jgi:hypothetical protein